MGGIPTHFGAHVLLLLSTVEPVASVALGLSTLRTEQPDKEAFQGSSPLAWATNVSFFFLPSSNVWKTANMMHIISLLHHHLFFYSLSTDAGAIEQCTICISITIFRAALLSVSCDYGHRLRAEAHSEDFLLTLLCWWGHNGIVYIPIHSNFLPSCSFAPCLQHSFAWYMSL
jgi:hypothetical protein